jgi:hypothetical protein
MWPVMVRVLVVPVCIETKTPAALNATLSQRPDTAQQARTGRSAYVREMSSRSRVSQLRFSPWDAGVPAVVAGCGSGCGVTDPVVELSGIAACLSRSAIMKLGGLYLCQR